tara:strand:- start:1508 stop:2365 length:858 start_codon:yes stop_codon:yes gene_type:complete
MITTHMQFSFVIQTFDRVDQTIKLLLQLSSYKNYGKIYLSDSGGRGKLIFERKLSQEGGKGIEFEYIDNSACKTGHLHMWKIYDLNLKNMFLFHDDDLIVNSSFDAVLKTLINNPEIKYLCSTNKGCSNFLDNFDKLSSQRKINQILKLYFLSHNGNCLLLTGLYTKNPGIVRKEIDNNFHISGKYYDVAMISWLFSQEKSKIVDNSYMNYINHDANDNLVRCLESRKSLKDFIRNQPGILNNIISRLIFYGYKSHRVYFISGILFSFFFPPIWLHLYKKIISRI